MWRVTAVSPVNLTANIQKTDVKCFNGSDGTATVTVNGGTGNYSYSWAPSGGSGSTATGLKAGTYTVTINDNTAACVITASVTINQPPLLQAAIPSNTPAKCNGGSDGTATGSGSGGTPGYSYAWSNGQSGPNASGLAAGSYTLTVTDANGCTKTATVVITEPAKMITATSTTNVTCFSGNNGTATDNPQGGGTPPYSFVWSTSPAQTTQTATGLIAGAYSVTVTDQKGCKVIDNVTITEPGITIAASDASCHAGSDGTATVTPSGPSPSYTYLWSNGGTSQTITGLIAGNYSVTVTDAYSCVISKSTVVNEPSPLVIGLSKTDVSCFNGSNGTATVSASGGTPGYTYLWMPSAQSTASASNLAAGSYHVTVTDAKACTIVDSITLIQPPPVLATITASKNITCNGGNDGSASIAGSGGMPGYTYSWNTTPAQNTQNATTLTAGSHTGIVTDANGCLATASVLLTEPSKLIAAISSSTDVSCHGGKDGAATVTASGSVPPYTYLWNTSPSQTTTSINNLQVGLYSVTVTDANLCIQTTSIFISEPAPLILNTAQTNVSCFGGKDGTLSVLPSGGNAPYQYVWNTVPVQTAQTAVGLQIGTYSVTVTDSKGCINSISGSITEPTPLAVSHTQIHELCFGGNTATATENPSGGTLPYAYSWNTNPIQTTQTASGLTSGNYVVTVKDKNQCTLTDQITINEPSALVASIPFSKNVNCFDGNDGLATASGAGGTPPYTYSWSSSPIQNTQTAINLINGLYVVTVTDNNGCTNTSSVQITQPNILTIGVVKVTQVSCYGLQDGSIQINVTGGTTPYLISWNSTPAQNTLTATLLPAGTYTVLVTDANQCKTSTSAQVIEPAQIVPTINAVKNVSCFGGNDGNITTQVAGGTAPYTYAWNTNPAQFTATANNLPKGSYTVTVTDVFLCSNQVSANVTEPPLLVSSVTPDKNVSCYGGNDGAATVTVSGGTLPYTYLWNTIPAQTDRSAQGLKAGSYQVTVTDFLNCTSVSSVQILEPTAIAAVISSSKNVSCFGGNDGQATVSASGGTPLYVQLWSTVPSQTSTNATGLSMGNYTVTVSDANNCSITANIQISEPPILTSLISAKKNVSCYNGNDGSAAASQTGGTAPYTYLWSNGATTANINTLTAGIYSVTITDVNYCTDTVQVYIYEPTILVSNISGSSNVKCKNGNDGAASVFASGGTPMYSYQWNSNPFQNTAAASNLSAGTYQVMVTDQNGCIASSVVIITEPDSVKIQALGATTICIDQSAMISSLASGGTPPYAYVWNNGVTTSSQMVSPIITTLYTVSCTDFNACLSQPSNVLITVRDSLHVLANGDNTICQKQNTAISALASGGDGNYLYSWSNAATGAGPIFVNPMQNTTYVVTVNDGCGTPSVQDSVLITVKPLPIVKFSGDTLKGCQPHTVNFTDLSNVLAPSGLAGWYWNFGDKPGAANNSGIQNPSHTYFDAGVFSVKLIVTSTDFCVDSLTLNTYIISYPLPVADFISQPQRVNILNPKISFLEKASGENSYLWDFGDGSTSKEANPSHLYAQPGTYNACLTVTSQFRCVDEICHTVVVDPDFTFYIPNAFSPNEDGVNDTFGGSGIGIKSYSLFIFDRWGNRIFVSEDLNKQWDGKANSGSMIAQQDVYVYIVKLTDIFDVEHKYVGHVTLVK